MDGIPQRCSVFLTPSRDDFSLTETIIRELSAKHDASPFEPHVTVYSGVLHDLDILKKTVTRAIEGVTPFLLTVRGIGWSEEFFKTLFIEFEENATLRGLHDRIKAGLAEDSGYRFLPHLSLLYKDMPLTAKEALARRIVLDRSEIRFDMVRIVTPRNIRAGWRDTGMWETLFSVKLEEGE